jgi:hypothetical protein
MTSPTHAHPFGTPCHSRCPRWGRTATAADWFTAQPEPCDPAADAARAWRDCAHRADYASAAEHERECPAHGLDAQPADAPRR